MLFRSLGRNAPAKAKDGADSVNVDRQEGGAPASSRTIVVTVAEVEDFSLTLLWSADLSAHWRGQDAGLRKMSLNV